MIDLDKLEQLARAATPGPWHAEHFDRGSEVCLRGYPRAAVELSYRDNFNDENDAAYIAAASPDVVLALIVELRDLKATSRTLTDAVLAFFGRGVVITPGLREMLDARDALERVTR